MDCRSRSDKEPMRSRAVFLDRDGILIEDTGYPTRVEELRILPGAIEAVREVNRAGFLALVVTNQSAVARGMIDETGLRALHAFLTRRFIEGGARLDRIYYCPHHSEFGSLEYRLACSCRKPEPGLLLTAAEELSIDLSGSCMIGDRMSDIEAGHRAGCLTILVDSGVLKTGDKPIQDPSRRRPDYVARDLKRAVRWFTRHARLTRPRAANDCSERD